MLLQTDSRRRITFPPATGLKPGDTVELELLPDGRMIVTPVVTIPKHQLWSWTPETREAVAASLSDSRASVVAESQADVERIASGWERED
jgi:hypothetical protein